MPHFQEQSRSVLIAAVFCAIVGLIAYAGYLQNGWAGISFTSDIHQAAIGGQKKPTGAR
jgi:hypothetical protein